MLEFAEKTDFMILDFIQAHMINPVADKIMIFFTMLGNGGLFWIALTITLLCSKRTRKAGIAATVGLCLCFIIGNLILKPTVARLRPFQIKEGIELLIKAPRDYSFPSGHTLASVTTALIVFFYYKKAGAFLIAASLLTAFSRLYLYVHFPSDVLAGLILSVIFAFASRAIENCFSKKEKN